MATLVIEFNATKCTTFYSNSEAETIINESRRQKQLLMRLAWMMFLNQRIQRLYQTDKIS